MLSRQPTCVNDSVVHVLSLRFHERTTRNKLLIQTIAADCDVSLRAVGYNGMGSSLVGCW